DPDPQGLPALEAAGGLVFLAHRIGAVVADAQTVPSERELAGLGLQRPLCDDLVVDVELRGADRLAVLARLLARELHPKGVLAGLDVSLRDKLLLGLDAEEVVDVMQLPALHEKRVAAEAGSVREDDARGVRIADLDVRQNLVRAAADVRPHPLGYAGRVRVIKVALADRFLGGSVDGEKLDRGAIVER